MGNINSGQYKAKPVVWAGLTYRSLEEMARDRGTSAQRLRYYLKNDKPFDGHIIDYKIEENGKK